MKKIITFSLFSFLLLFAACSSHDAKSVAGKIEKHEQLDQKDYSTMIDYLNEAFDKLQNCFKGDKVDQEQIEKIDKEYQYAEPFMMALASADNLDKDNKVKFDRLTEKIETLYASMLTSPSGPIDIDPETMPEEADEAQLADTVQLAN